MKNRYLLLAQDYMRLADLKERAHAYRTPATVEENAARAATMTGRFPAPWRIVEIPRGFAVDDATGQQLAVFFGLADPNTARDTDFLTIDEARQMAVDFAKLPELLEQTLGRSEVATSPEDDRLAKLETNRSPQAGPETSRLPRAAQLSVITVTGSPLVKAPTTIRRSIPFEPDRRRSTRMLRPRRHPVSIRTKFMIVIAVAALPAGYFMFESSDRPFDVAVGPRSTADIPPVEFLPLREARAPAAIPPLEFLPLREAQAPAVSTNAESRIEREVETAPLQPTVPLDMKPIENGIEARPPQTLPQKEGQSFTPSQDASTCFPSASAVRQNYPGGWPSWTLKAPGHEGVRCWYPATRTTAHDHRSEMRKKETAAGVKKDDDTSVAAIVAKKDDDTSKAAAAVKLDVDSAGGSTEMAGARLMESANLAVQRESRLKDDGAEVPNGVIKPSANASETNSGAAQVIADREPAPSALSNDANFYRERGVAAYRSGDFLGAIGNFDEAIRLNPNDAQSYNIRGNVWDELGIYERALADYDEAIRIDPNNPAVFHDRAILWYRKGALDEALVDLDRAIRFSFADANIYCDRGLVWYQKGHHDRAIADFNKAIKLDPSFAAAYLNRGLILHRNKEFNAAIAAVYPAIRVDPSIFDVNRRANMRP
jgi:tetratricopeptide (TPR) repeat protein